MPIIYALTCKDPTKIYFGSSIMTKEQRLKSHNDCCKRWKNGIGGYCASFELFEIGDVEIHIVMDCPDVSKLELREIEQIYLDNCECVNIMNAFLTEEQKKEQKYKASYKYLKSDKRKEYVKEYEVSDRRIQQKKLYAQSDKRKEYLKQYRLKKKGD
jgi:hypothetical protein